MSLALAHVLVFVAACHTAAGLLLLPWWWLRGLARLDAVASAAPWTAKLLWVPGLVMLWPVLIRRGLSGSGHPIVERNAHRCAARTVTS